MYTKICSSDARRDVWASLESPKDRRSAKAHKGGEVEEDKGWPNQTREAKAIGSISNREDKGEKEDSTSKYGR